VVAIDPAADKVALSKWFNFVNVTTDFSALVTLCDHKTNGLGADAVIITAIGETPAHIEFFESRKHLVEEKSILIKTLKKSTGAKGGDGILVLNADDESVIEMKEKTRRKNGRR
jgi:hypothetical protein